LNISKLLKNKSNKNHKNGVAMLQCKPQAQSFSKTYTRKKRFNPLQASQLKHFVSLVICLHFKLQAQAKKYLTPFKVPNKTLFLGNH
jgi:hypothetical protein